MYDLLICNGKIVDGSGRPAYGGNVAIVDGRIAAVGEVTGEARRAGRAAGSDRADNRKTNHQSEETV